MILKKGFCLAVVATLLALGLAQGGTWEQRLDIPSGFFNDICVLPGGQNGWAIASAGAAGEVFTFVLRTTNGGAQWTSCPFPDSTAVGLNGVSFVNASTGWVVGSSGRIYKTTDGGNTWTRQTSPTSRGLVKVHFISASRGWAAGGWQDGSTYLVVRTTNGGTTWQDQSFGTDAYSVSDVFFADSLNGWIGGYDNTINPHLHHTTDGGANWVRQTLPLPTGNGQVTGIDFPTPQKGWASTSSLYQTPAGSVLYTTDGGTTWTVQYSTNYPYNDCLDAQDTLRVAIPAYNVFSSAERAFVTTNGGAGWTQNTVPVASYTYGVQYVGTSLWLAESNGAILRSTNNGANWAWEYYGPMWSDLAFSDSLHGWVVSGSNVGTDGYSFRTADGGATWARDPNAPGGSHVTFVNANRGWMFWPGNSASVWRTTNGGTSWSQFFIGASAWVEGIVFATQDSGWAHGGSGTIRFTSNGGASWASQTSGTTQFLQTMFFVTSREGWAAGGYGGGNGTILHTTDGGATWNPQTPALSDHIAASFFLNNQRGWLVGYGGRVQRTTDGGATWEAMSQVNHYYVDDIHFQDAQTGWLGVSNQARSQAPDDGRGFIYKTTDGGATWTQEWASPRVKTFFGGLGVQGVGTLWACAGHGTLLKYIPGSGVEEKAEGRGQRLEVRITAKPNPFVSFARVPGHEAERFSLYDISGRKVGTYKGDRIGEGLSAGVYFLRPSDGPATPIRLVNIR
jgi:photosystem II stability/assembly factor-like uncharacterized protein